MLRYHKMPCAPSYVKLSHCLQKSYWRLGGMYFTTCLTICGHTNTPLYIYLTGRGENFLAIENR